MRKKNNKQKKQRNIYSNDIAEIVRKNKYVPRKINSDIYLKLYHRYYCNYSETYFKVQRIYLVNNIEYYSVNYSNNMGAELSGPYNVDYELLTDYRNVEKENIINSNNSYYGREIKYWFFINNIDLNDPKYSEFWSFLNPNNKRTISDDKLYFVNAVEVNNMYKNCTITIDNG